MGMRTIALPGQPRHAFVTAHAIERWIERVRWRDRYVDVVGDMAALAKLSAFTLQPPDWWNGHQSPVRLLYGYVTAGDVCLIIAHKRDETPAGGVPPRHGTPLVVATVMTRGELREHERDERHKRTRERRRRVRHHARKAGGTRGPRGRERRALRDRIERDTDTRRWPE